MKREDEKTRLRRKVHELRKQIERLQRQLPQVVISPHRVGNSPRAKAAQLAAEIADTDT
jgi:glutaredoxin